ncbi:MAG: hypothetical protein AAGE76_14260 [Pseudomonadota bacterium]
MTPIMVHHLRKPGPAATAVERMRIITEPKVELLKSAFATFCAALGDENVLNDIKRIGALLAAHNFTRPAFVNTYTVAPKS